MSSKPHYRKPFHPDGAWSQKQKAMQAYRDQNFDRIAAHPLKTLLNDLQGLLTMRGLPDRTTASPAPRSVQIAAL